MLRSRAGEGTTADLWLPAAEPQGLSEDDNPISPETVPEHARSSTVLAVDDDALVLMNTALMLEDLGYRVIEAHSGAGALEVLENQNVDLLITDQMMPRMNGTDLVKAARQLRPDLPAILATGYMDLEEAKELGVPRLDKPFSFDQLKAIVHEAIGG